MPVVPYICNTDRFLSHYTTFLLLLVNLTVPFLHLISITVDSHKKGSEAVFAGSQCRIF